MGEVDSSFSAFCKHGNWKLATRLYIFDLYLCDKNNKYYRIKQADV